MKHFSVSPAPFAAGAAPGRNADWEDELGMTEQGFRKFRRRGGRGQELDATGAGADMDSSGGSGCSRAAGAAPQELRLEGKAQLPSVLPEPWQQFRRLPLDMRAQDAVHLPLVNFFRNSPTAKAFDLLRTRLLHTLRAHGWKRVAVSAPAAGCGVTFSAVNLALSLARVPNSRTVLMDMNFRRPGVAKALGLDEAGDLAAFLSGQIPMEQHLVRPADTLALGLNGFADRNAAEILHDSRCAAVIDDMMERTRADVALFDLPPVLEHDDVPAFLPQVDGVLLISDGTQTTASQLAACEKMLSGHTQLLGVALNRARS